MPMPLLSSPPPGIYFTPPPSRRCGGDEGLHSCSHGGGAADAAGVASCPGRVRAGGPPDVREWKAKYKKTYKYAGEEECRYAVFRSTRCRVARAKAAGVTTSGLNGLSDHASEEFLRGHGVRRGEKSYKQETRRMFVGWKAKYGKTYRDAGEEQCRYMLFKENRRFVVKLNAAAAGETAYGLNQFGDLTDEEVSGCYDGRGGEMEGKLSARCQAAVAGDSVYDNEGLVRSQEGKLSARCQAVAGGIIVDERPIRSQA